MATNFVTTKTIYEFLLWNNCPNNCKFCFQKANKEKYPGKFLNGKQMVDSIETVNKYICKHVPDGSSVLLVGGELFNLWGVTSNRVLNKFCTLIDLIIHKVLRNEINIVFMNTSLLYKDMTLLHIVLDAFKNNDILKRLRLATSYDRDFRFESEEARNLVVKNIHTLKSEINYPDLPLIANCILTKHVCKAIREEGYYEETLELLGIPINLIPYIKLHEDFAPTREEVHNTLLHLLKVHPGFLREHVAKNVYVAPKFLWEYNADKNANKDRKRFGNLVDATAPNAECGHNVNFRRVYADDNRCHLCDLEKLLDTVAN